MMPPEMELRLFRDKMAFQRAYKLYEDIGITNIWWGRGPSQLEGTAKTGFRMQECALGRA